MVYSNDNINNLYEYHINHGKFATMTVVKPPGRFGSVKINQGKVEKFIGEACGRQQLHQWRLFVISLKAIKDCIENEKTIWEKEPLENLVKDNELHAYNHQDFWQPMDTLRDKRLLDEYWENNSAP